MLPKRSLMGPGPSDVYPEVLAAMARPCIGHLDPAFVEFMDGLNERLRYAFQTRNEVTLPISAPGSAGMECCFVNLLEPGEKVIIASNGWNILAVMVSSFFVMWKGIAHLLCNAASPC